MWHLQKPWELTSKSFAFSMSLATSAIWRSLVREEPVFHMLLGLLLVMITLSIGPAGACSCNRSGYVSIFSTSRSRTFWSLNLGIRVSQRYGNVTRLWILTMESHTDVLIGLFTSSISSSTPAASSSPQTEPSAHLRQIVQPCSFSQLYGIQHCEDTYSASAALNTATILSSLSLKF